MTNLADLARIIYEADPVLKFFDRPDGPPGNQYVPWERVPETVRALYVETARKVRAFVLEGLLQPTPEMIEAGLNAPLTSLGNGQYLDPSVADIWQAMLLEAMKGGGDG